MNPWLWFLAGWLFAWLPAVLALGLTLIFDFRTERDEDKYWREQMKPLRVTYAVIGVGRVHSVSRN